MTSNDTYFFFLVRPKDASHTSYEHCAVALAEGLTALGKRVVANIDHWPRSDGSLLFRHDAAVDPSGCAAMIFTESWPIEGNAFPDVLHDAHRSATTVYLDKEDGSRIVSLSRGFPAFDFVLRTHFCRNARYPSNFRPWAFGLSERILRATEAETPVPVESRLLVSYRHTQYPHSVRVYVDDHVLPRLGERLNIYQFVEPFDGAPPLEDVTNHALWALTGRRHSPAYFAALRGSSACAAFGGYFVLPWHHNPTHPLGIAIKTALTKSRRRSSQITQWDSWRLWESLAAGCATFHLDLERYGAVLPEMPRNWEHYIGMDLGRLDRSLERLRDEPNLIERIGLAGRAWVREHYAPVPTAERFLRTLGNTERRAAAAQA